MHYSNTILFKRILLGLAAALLVTAVMFACKKGDDEDNSSVDPADVNKLQSVLQITGSSIISGSLPTPSSGSSAPKLSLSQSSASISPGGLLVLPFQFTSQGGYNWVYIQVDGATNGCIRIPASSITVSGNVIGIMTGIPSRVLLGDFCVSYCIEDSQGRISNVINTCVTLREALSCINANASGHDGLTFTSIEMGDKSGTAKIIYDTYTVPDRIDVYQGNKWLTGTGTDPKSLIPPLSNCSTASPGFVGKSSTLSFPYNPSDGKTITVVVSGCLGGGTAWDWEMDCP